MDINSLLSSAQAQWASRNTQIYLKNDPAFAAETQRWNAYEAPTYSAAVRPGTEEDVQKAIKVATAAKVPFLVTGGNHGYSTTFGRLDNGLDIDMRNFNSVTIDKNAQTMTIGGGTIVNQIFDPLYEAGFELPTGVCSTVGVTGLTFGGGIGRYQGIHGLVLDSLQSVRLVTAAGDLITASATSNSDLFWGLRGAGANFGVVTQATYKIYPLTNGGNVQNADLVFVAAQAEALFTALQKFKEAGQPKELSAIVLISFSQETGEAQLLLNLDYPGPQDKFAELIAPFLAVGPVVQSITTVPWNKLTTTAGFGVDAMLSVKGQPHSIFSANLKKINAATWTDIFNKTNAFYKSTPAAAVSAIVLEIYSSQGLKQTPADATAYPWRDNEAYVMFQMSWMDPTVTDAANAFARQVRDLAVSTSGYSGLTTYVSYAHGDETQEQMYGADKLPRLKQLKKKWDPQNVFRFNNPIQA